MEEIEKPQNSEPYEVEEVILRKEFTTDPNYKHEIVWKQVAVHALLQASWFIGAYTLLFHAKWATIIWTYSIGFFIAQSIALGAHRYFTHKAFKLVFPMHVMMLFFQTMAGQNSLYTWVRDHKIHHKYSDTDADPHNANRGFFFSHMGWLMVKRHPLVKRMMKEIDMTDIQADKLIMFQYNYFLPLYFVIGVLIPVGVPMYFWNETFWSAFFVAYCYQYVTNLHITWVINSIAHLWGNRPYDNRIKAVNSSIAWLITTGDGWHNFHHSFPWDSKLSEYGQHGGLSTNFLHLMEYLGLAYDLKTASPKVVHGHMKRHGDAHAKKIDAERQANNDDQRESYLETWLNKDLEDFLPTY